MKISVKGLLVLSLMLVQAIQFCTASRNISLITYGIEDGEVFVKWKSSEDVTSFSIYRSPVLISNVSSFSNSLDVIRKVETIAREKVRREGEYFYYQDPRPNLGTNYYFVFANKGGGEIIEFVPEQNYSVGFINYLPLPKVIVELATNVNSVVIKWERTEGAEGYLVYKIPDGFTGRLLELQPLAKLSSNETVFFDVIPSDTNFLYIVIPFSKHVTNYHFSRRFNSVFVGMGGLVESVPYTKNTQHELKESPMDYYATSRYVMSNYVTNYITNYMTNYITNEVTHLHTNVVVVTNMVFVTNLPLKEKRSEVIASTEASLQRDYDYQVSDAERKLKYIVSRFFSKKKYLTAKKMLEELLEEAVEEDEIRGRVMVYLARSEYALGNKEEAVKILFRAKKILPEEADFWLSRFLGRR